MTIDNDNCQRNRVMGLFEDCQVIREAEIDIRCLALSNKQYLVSTNTKKLWFQGYKGVTAKGNT